MPSKANNSGLKPSVAFHLEDAAQANISAKIALLRARLESGEKLTDLPTSLRQFNAWTPPNPVTRALLRKNANETLARNPGLRAAALSLIEQAVFARQPKATAGEKAGARLREKIELHRRIREIAEAELLRAREQTVKLERELSAQRAQVRSMEAEAQRIRENYESRIANLQAQNAELTRSLKPPIRGI